MTMYAVYGKHKDWKRYRAFDMNANWFVANRIRMTLFTEEQLPALKREVDYMNKHNPEYTFEIRKVR